MKRRADFHFKKFSVAHDRSTHKVGTDGVLLGAWVNVGHAKRILDIGTGTGVIALMLAQRSIDTAHIDAIEIESGDASQAEENIRRSPWPEKIHVINTSVQAYIPSMKYDLIVSNPPYFINSWKPPDNKRSAARHTHELSYEELLHATSRLLNDQGVFGVILPYLEGTMFIEMAKSSKLFPRRQLIFRSRNNKPPERILVEFSRQQPDPESEELILHSEGNNWSDAYKNLTRDFYLKI